MLAASKPRRAQSLIIDDYSLCLSFRLVLQAWLDGGYSDDLILAAICSRHRLPVLAPRHAIFPQMLDRDTSWRQFWNYMRRQIYVLDTYSGLHNRRVNHGMMVALFGASCTCAASLVLAAAALTRCLVAFGSKLYLLRLEIDSRETGGIPEGVGGASPAQLIDACHNCSCMSSLLPLAGLLFCHAGARHMIIRTQQLLDVLHARSPPFAAVRWHWFKLWAAVALSYCVIPACILCALLNPRIVWGGTTYHKRAGKVVKVVRSKAAG